MKQAKKITTITSESDLRKKIFTDFKQKRTINQAAFYLGDGVDRYYNPNAAFVKNYDYSKITQLLARILIKKPGLSVAIVSLGCGSCETDKVILEQLQELGHNFSFFGVDSSLGMVRKANDILHNTTFNTHLICADFGADNFEEELDEVIGHYDIKIFASFGGTLGNLDQGYISDILRNILRPGDYLLLDVAGFKTITSLNKLQLFERYVKYVDNPPEVAFFLAPLKSYGIPSDSGKLILDISTDYTTQAQVFTFKFKIKKLAEIHIRRKKVRLTPNERIDVFKVLVYDFNELIKFFKQKDFELKEQLNGGYRNQFLFERQ